MSSPSSSQSLHLDIVQAQVAEDTKLKDTAMRFPIVGIGASAGGLEAFTQLFSHLPTDTGMAFVLIQHLAPQYKSALAELLAKTTAMPVSQAQEGMVVEPNQVYVIPPNTKMTLVQGQLRLLPREKIRGTYLPVDAFFTSLARDRGHKAIGVVLSGGDGDGSVGVEMIKAAGGVTFAQCQGTAQVDSMPNTAVATGHVDFILPPAAIAEELAKLSRHPFVADPPSRPISDIFSADETALTTIFALLQSVTGVDFSHYESKTLNRRMQRRMLLYKLEQLADYAQYLQDHPAEVQALYQEILIHVTGFFRDPEVFQALTAQVLPIITRNKSAADAIRIWIAGCSTGEEVYSIAICLLEFLKDAEICPAIQVFATDISEIAIETARSGIYTDDQMIDVSPERRTNFFFEVEGGYQINKSIRERCVFAKQDLSSDPPFSNLDLISCRNVLIYLGVACRKQVIPVFHFALKSTGFLLLGTSESVEPFSNLFAFENRKNRIYAKQTVDADANLDIVKSYYPAKKVNAPQQSNQAAVTPFDLPTEIDRMILNRFAQAGVLIDDHLNVLQILGEASLYVRFAAGKASLNVLKMAREGLLAGLRTAIHQAKRQNAPVRKAGLCVEIGETSKIVTLEVIPFKALSAKESYFLVLFEDAAPLIESDQVKLEGVEQGDFMGEMTQLRNNLVRANQERTIAQSYLQTIIQEHKQFNQDLSIANEEILSSNEELQSLNEELETAKEEIQATNEELNTTNEELRSRNLALYQVNNDLTNLLSAINIPIVILENDLRVRQFTPLAQSIFSLIAADVGRPLSDIRCNLDLPDLRQLILEVINTLNVKELEVQTQAGYWYILRIRPYRTPDNQIDGAVLVFMDINDLKSSAAKLEAARQEAESANQAKDAFLSNLSHELRNPLNALLGWAQLLKKGDLDQTTSTQAIAIVERNAKAQAQLIEDLLDLSRITSGKLHLTLRLIDFAQVVRAVIEMIRLSADAKTIQFVSQVHSAMVSGDIDRLQQVLWNLLSNAVKFTNPGGQITITLEALDGQAQLQVSDTGKGIQPDLLPHIFDRFCQGDASSTKADQGLGLGLAIVQQLVELHGGTVQATSAGIGQGTQITVKLPLQASAVPIKLENPANLTAVAAPLPNLSPRSLLLAGLCILTVDDTLDSRELLKFVLEEEGAEVTTAASVREAIVALTENPGKYHVLLADIGMPEEDGFDLIRQVRAITGEAGGNIPAAAITGFASDHDRQRVIDAGFQTHIAKPFDLHQLCSTVAHLAGRSD